MVRLSALPDVDYLQIGLWFAAFVVSLTFHEAAHAWTASKLGDPTARLLGRLSLNPLVHIDPIGTVLFPIIGLVTGAPLIGWAKPVPVDGRYLRHPRRDFAIVAAAGPVSNLILAVVLAVVVAVMPRGGALDVVTYGLAMTVMVNVLLAVFNLIPVPPLDGGNILAGIVPGPVAEVIDRLRPYGFLVLYGLMLSGLLSRLISPVQSTLLDWLL